MKKKSMRGKRLRKDCEMEEIGGGGQEDSSRRFRPSRVFRSFSGNKQRPGQKRARKACASLDRVQCFLTFIPHPSLCPPRSNISSRSSCRLKKSRSNRLV